MKVLKFLFISVMTAMTILPNSNDEVKKYALEYFQTIVKYNYLSLNPSAEFEEKVASKYYNSSTMLNPGGNADYVAYYFIEKYSIQWVKYREEKDRYLISMICDSPIQMMKGGKVRKKNTKVESRFSVGRKEGQFYISSDPTVMVTNAEGVAVLCERDPSDEFCKVKLK
ncbi:hypothetical protein [Leptospira barantonii]|uniref:Uncharacterized protein n=1 Tax=Leptospira barantonii TaxID=2023184 RepID=A0ABX4NL04_9LEPT|nr:hypothetical protein [Leptospira barantonii]PJZ57521.1 hypothetical protein CH367_09255 [Leptospira barantonii]